MSPRNSKNRNSNYTNVLKNDDNKNREENVSSPLGFRTERKTKKCRLRHIYVVVIKLKIVTPSRTYQQIWHVAKKKIKFSYFVIVDDRVSIICLLMFYRLSSRRGPSGILDTCYLERTLVCEANVGTRQYRCTLESCKRCMVHRERIPHPSPVRWRQNSSYKSTDSFRL